MSMQNFINTYGNMTFSQKPFCEIDNIIFSQLVYIDFDGIVGNDAGLPLATVCEKYFQLHSQQEIDTLIGISQKAVALMVECSKVVRYKDIVVSEYVNNINDAIDKQFAAVNFVLDEQENIVVAFRGTDVTVTGVKESAMLSYMFPVPAQIQALHYFQETAMTYKGDVRICGHSKGGNLAAFAGVSCSNSLKKRIVGIYENDAPGFPSHFYQRYDYQQIKDKIFLFTPQSSIIGRLLDQDVQPIIVVSTNSGLKQHQVSSWTVVDDHFEYADCYENSSDVICEYINNLIDYIGEDDLELFFEVAEHIITILGVEDFYDLKSTNLKKRLTSIDTLNEIDQTQKDFVKTILHKIISDYTKNFVGEKTKTFIDKHRKPKEENING